jgi:2-iminoacetate synthase ThiH
VNGGEVSKETFLTIYGAAHIRALSPALVKKAFEKTGIWPFNPDVVPAEMMALSKETSRKGHLPFAQSTPIRIAAQRLEHVLQPPTESVALSIILDDVGDITAIVNSAIRQLQDPATDYLARNSPIKPTAQLPPIATTMLSPIKQRLPRLLQHDATTPLERELIKKLQDVTIKEAYLKGKIAGLQGTTILQDAYLHRVQGQLQTKEGKRTKGWGLE